MSNRSSNGVIDALLNLFADEIAFAFAGTLVRVPGLAVAGLAALFAGEAFAALFPFAAAFNFILGCGFLVADFFADFFGAAFFAGFLLFATSF